MKTSKRDEKLINIYFEMYPFVDISSAGDLWFIESPDYNEEFGSYKDFIEFIEDEVKESLLVYALNGELSEVVEMIKEA